MNNLRLTEKQYEVLQLLPDNGPSTIAKILKLSPKTVKNYLRIIYQELGVGDRLNAVLKAYEMGIINL